MVYKHIFSLLISLCIFTGAAAQADRITATVNQPAGSVLLPSADHESSDTISPSTQPLYTAENVLLYLPAPANFAVGFTASGNQVDVIILGPRLSKEAGYEILPIGVMEFDKDSGVTSRILAIPANPSFQTIKSPTLEQLRLNYPGVIEILTIWFENAFADRQSTVTGLLDEQAATQIFSQ